LSGARRHLLHGDRLLHASLRLNIRNQVNTDSALGEKTSNPVSKRSSSRALPLFVCLLRFLPEVAPPFKDALSLYADTKSIFTFLPSIPTEVLEQMNELPQRIACPRERIACPRVLSLTHSLGGHQVDLHFLAERVGGTR
jgi:hypothetical protein